MIYFWYDVTIYKHPLVRYFLIYRDDKSLNKEFHQPISVPHCRTCSRTSRKRDTSYRFEVLTENTINSLFFYLQLYGYFTMMALKVLVSSLMKIHVFKIIFLKYFLLKVPVYVSQVSCREINLQSNRFTAYW